MKYLIGFLFIFSVHAHEIDNSSTTYVNDNKGQALAIAKSQHHFYLGTHDPQWSVGFGSVDDQHAISFSAGKKFDRVFISGSIGIESNEIGIGIGIGGKF